jgi:hypothetical protein
MQTKISSITGIRNFITIVLLWTLVFFVTWLVIQGVPKTWLTPNSHMYSILTGSMNYNTIPQTTLKNPIEDLPSELKIELEELLNQEHNNAYITSLRTKDRCELDPSTCDKIERAGTYTPTIKRRYETLTIWLINTLDTVLSQWNPSRICLQWLKLYEDTLASRGAATHTTIRMNTSPLESFHEYRQVLTHELGHVVDLCGIHDSSNPKDQNFTEFGNEVFGIDDPSIAFYRISRESERVRKPWSRSTDFISGYAAKNPFEDFAEAHNAYLNHYSKFQTLATANPILQQKFAFMQALFDNDTFDILERPRSHGSDLSYRVWDTTRWE